MDDSPEGSFELQGGGQLVTSNAPWPCFREFLDGVRNRFWSRGVVRAVSDGVSSGRDRGAGHVRDRAA